MKRTALATFAISILGTPLISATAIALECSSGIPRPPQSGPPTFAAPPEFTLNFTPLDQPAGSVGHMPACIMDTAIVNKISHSYETYSTSKFLTQHAWWSSAEHWQGPQIVSYGGQDYYHVIVGDSTTDFVQEYYIPFSSNMRFHYDNRNPNPSPILWQWAANTPLMFSTTEPWHSSSGGSSYTPDPGTAIMDRWMVIGVRTVPGNGMSPLKDVDKAGYQNLGTNLPNGKIIAGNGSGNPRKVIMRQRLKVGEIEQEFVKASFNNKPLISQVITDPNMVSTVEIDMTAHNYSSYDNRNLRIVNTLTFNQSNPEYQGIGNWTMASPDGGLGGGAGVHQKADAGQYIFTPGDPNFDGAYGTYTYAPNITGFDHDSTNWEAYYDPCHPDNIWSWNDFKPTKTCN